jgi:hypothetical protein
MTLKPMSIATTALVASVTTLGACGADGANVGVSVAALSSDGASQLTSTDGAGTNVAITSGQLAVRDIEFDLPVGATCADVADQLEGARCEAADNADEAGEAKIIIDGPMVIDLVQRTATPSLDAVRIPAGTYRRVDVRVESSAALDDAALVVDLAFDWAETASRATLRLDFSEDIRTESPGGIDVAAGEDLVTRFVVDGWLAGADLVACLEDLGAAPGDATTVTGDDCGAIETAVKNNFKESADLVDSDDD